MRILFLQPYPTEGPSSRYRVEQYVPYLRENGVECIVRPFVSSAFYKILYRKGFYLQKACFFFLSTLRRFFDIFTALRADIVFIHLEAFPLGAPLIEWFLAKMGKRIIYDLDDAIYLRVTSSANRFIRYFKSPSKISKIIAVSSHIITCNEHLANYARKFNKNVTVIHTSVDTEKFVSRFSTNTEHRTPNTELTIGWIGSHSTTPYIESLKEVFIKLAESYKFNLKIIGAGFHNIEIPGIDVMNLEWRLEDEIAQFQSLDIGVYPLPDNEWTSGKTGFKTIQYMSVGVPCVVSNVGTNKDIVRDGMNGFLVDNEEEWVARLAQLIEDGDLRKRLGEAGRSTVEERFSLRVNAPRVLEVINSVFGVRFSVFGCRTHTFAKTENQEPKTEISDEGANLCAESRV